MQIFTQNIFLNKAKLYNESKQRKAPKKTHVKFWTFAPPINQTKYPIAKGMINRIFKAKFLPDLLRFFRGKGETLDFLTRKKWYRWRVSWHSTSFTLAGRCSWDSGRSAAGRRLTESNVQAEAEEWLLLSFCRSK